ncbi:MAG: extensin family protein [Alphaproteobacteria bacterium]|nr:extensin family protein [Alphaproteobacteria bacterium]
MRGVAAALLALLVLAGCAGERRAQPARPPDIRACFKQLEAMDGVRFRRVPDRRDSASCGWRQGVQLLDVGVPIRGAGTMTCPVALGVARWVRETAIPATRERMGSPLVGIDSMGTYACRTRNSRPGAPVSEHASANAIDISAVRLADGRRITVKAGWDGEDRAARRLLRDLHKGGCRRFNLVLGPEDGREHEDHFHFDMGRWVDCR